jgi:hypothetical protein
VYQVTDNLTLNAYYGLEHEGHRLPQDGTFFSPIPGLSEDSEFIVFPPPSSSDPADLTGQVRTGIRAGYDDRDEDGDFGFNLQYYVERWSLETSVIYMNVTDTNLHGVNAGFDFLRLAGILPPETKAGWDPGALSMGDGFWIYKDDIDIFGLSFAKEIAGVSVGLDLVRRQDTGLAQSLGAVLGQAYNVPDGTPEGALGPITYHKNPDGTNMTREQFMARDSSSSTGPIGDNWSVILNGVGLLNNNWGLWEGGSYIVEAVATAMDDCSKGCQTLDNRIKEDQVFITLAGVFRPTWFQVYPGTDLTLPMSFSYNLGNSEKDKSPHTFGGDGAGGTLSLGAELLINQQWTVRTSWNSRFGPVNAGIGGLLKDRDNVTMTVKRTF